MFTVQRYPIAVAFRLSETDKARLDRLLNRYGSTFGTRGDSARFRLMLKNIDKALLSPWDAQQIHDAYQRDKEGNEAEELHFKEQEKQKAQKRAVAQMPKQRSPPDSSDLADDRNWDFGEGQEKEEEDPGSED